MKKDYRLVEVEPDIFKVIFACFLFIIPFMFFFSMYIPEPNFLEACGMTMVTLILFFILVKFFMLLFKQYKLEVVYIDKDGNEY